MIGNLGVHPVTDHLGALVTGCDLATADDATIAALREVWLEHSVIVIRGQELTDRQLVAFGHRFGDVDVVPYYDAKPFYPDVPDELQVITNVGPAGEPVGGLANHEADWHTDQSYADPPPSMSLLYALEVPAHGGDTWFLSTYRAFETLPAQLRIAAERMVIEHDGALNTAGTPRAGAAGAGFQAHHPAVRTHSETGRPTLYLGRRRGTSVVAGDPNSLDALWRHACDDANTPYVHQWRPGDVVAWDNRSTMHRRDSFDPGQRRVLRRLQLRG